MAKSVPEYLERAVAESGDTQAEVLLSLVEATEAQTQAIERCAVALERVAEKIGNSWAGA